MATENNRPHEGGEPQDNAEAKEKGASRREGDRPRVFLLWRPMHYAERKWFEPLSAWLKSWALFDILDRVGKGVIVLSLGLYIAECGSRREATIHRAWGVIADATGKPGDLGRREALERLISSEQDLRYLDLSRANLNGMQLSDLDLTGVKLVDASLWKADLRRTIFLNADLSGAMLFGANLSEAKLWSANLRKADLYRANLSGANLRGASLVHANLSGANLDGAIVVSESWLEDVLHPVKGEPVKALDPDKWRVVHEEGDHHRWYRIRPVVEPSEP